MNGLPTLKGEISLKAVKEPCGEPDPVLLQSYPRKTDPGFH